MRSCTPGDPLSYAHRDQSDGWRHRLAEHGWEVYCPLCANTDSPDDATIMERNDTALLSTDRAVFLLDGWFTVGTPVEIQRRVDLRNPTTAAIVHTAGKPGVFVRTWQRQGVLVVPSFEELTPWLE